MEYRAIEFKVKGIVPLLMHNGHLADPQNPYARELAKFSGKKKTDADHEEISRIQWEGGFYLDDKGHPCVPGECIEGAIKNAAKVNRKGRETLIGVLCDGNWPLEYKGPKTVEGLRKKGAEFRDHRRVKVKQATVMHTRPIFRQWGLTFVVHYQPDIFDKDQVVGFLKTAGRGLNGAGFLDYRPKYGRFEVVEWKALD